jgi:ABC-2 type transport system ATP-binding protein
MKAIEAKNITKSFTKKKYKWPKIWSPEKTVQVAVDHLDLEIEEGEFVGFLGPNGAGKTTFLKILSGIMHPDSGTAKVLGFTPWERKFDYLGQMSMVMGQKNQLWWDLPAIDSYNMLKDVYSIDDKKFKANLEMMVGVLDMKTLIVKRLRDMSLGERMKCELAASLLHDPKIIFLDEPTIGLDVVSSQSIRKFLKAVNKEKKCTMILTSHYMGDIEALCERVVIINQGKKMYDGLLADLKNKYAPERKIEIFLGSLEEKKLFASIKGPKKISESIGIIRVQKDKMGDIVTEVFEKFEPENISISDIDTEEVIAKLFQKK